MCNGMMIREVEAKDLSMQHVQAFELYKVIQVEAIVAAENKVLVYV